MIKTIIKAMYSAFISIVLVSIVLGGWTSYAFISQSSKSSEIANVIQVMYASQKSVFMQIIELSKILIKDKNESIVNENNNFSVKTELQGDAQLDQARIAEDNGDNSLGIVIEPSLPESSKDGLPEISKEPLVNQQNEFPMNEMEMSS